MGPDRTGRARTDSRSHRVQKSAPVAKRVAALVDLPSGVRRIVTRTGPHGHRLRKTSLPRGPAIIRATLERFRSTGSVGVCHRRRTSRAIGRSPQGATLHLNRNHYKVYYVGREATSGVVLTGENLTVVEATRRRCAWPWHPMPVFSRITWVRRLAVIASKRADTGAGSNGSRRD